MQQQMFQQQQYQQQQLLQNGLQGNPMQMIAQPLMAFSQVLNSLGQTVAAGLNTGGWSGGACNAGYGGGGMPGQFFPGNNNQSGQNCQRQNQSNFPNQSNNSSMSNVDSSSTAGSQVSRKAKKKANKRGSNSQRAISAKALRLSLDRVEFGDGLHHEMLITSAGHLQLHGTVNFDGLCLMCPANSGCSGGNTLVIGDAVLAPLIKAENHLEEDASHRLSFLLAASLSPTDVAAMVLQAVVGKRGILGETFFSDCSILGDVTQSMIEGFKTKFWAQRDSLCIPDPPK